MLSRLGSTLRTLTPHFHFACTAVLALLAIPAIRHAGLPLRLNWSSMALFYWIGLGPRSVLCAIAFCSVTFPLSATIGPFFNRYRSEKIRIVLALIFFLAVNFALDFPIAVILTTVALAIVELAERDRFEGRAFRLRMLSVLGCAFYMFAGVILVLVYNDIIVAGRMPLSYDHALNQADRLLLHGQSVADIAHALFVILPTAMLRFLDAAYFQMFLLLGGVLVISAGQSWRKGVQFVGTCLTAYYLSLLIFYIWPSFGPYIFCARHAAEYPRYLTSFTFQQAGIAGLKAIAEHRVHNLGSGYYIAFPSMHIGLPLIGAWFSRQWRPVFWCLVAYTGLAAVAVVALEWHYTVDILGGVAVAALAVTMGEGTPTAAR